MPPAARIADPTTHGAPLTPGPGSQNVMIGFLPAWRAVIDQHACPAVSISGADGVGSVLVGSPTVFINNMMACRMGDIVVEKPGLAMGPANPILLGCPTVMIGDVGMGAPIAASSGAGMVALSSGIGGEAGSTAQALAKAAQNGAGTIVLAGNEVLSQALGGGDVSTKAGIEAAGQSAADAQKTWIEIQLTDRDGKPVPNEPYRVETPDGGATEGCTDRNGVARLDGIDPGTCKISFTALDQQAWSKG